MALCTWLMAGGSLMADKLPREGCVDMKQEDGAFGSLEEREILKSPRVADYLIKNRNRRQPHG